MYGPGRFVGSIPSWCDNMNHGFVGSRAKGHPGFRRVASVQSKVHGLRCAAGSFRTGSSVPERQQDMAVRGNIDPGLTESVVPARATVRNRLGRRRNKDFL